MVTGRTRAAAAWAAAVWLAAAAVSCGGGSRTDPSPAPEFSVTDLSGETRTLASYKGKVLVLNFWATWCPPCRAEIPDFIEAYGELKGQGLEILGLSVDDLAADALRAWVRDQKMNYPVALATPQVVRDYEPGDFIPATIVIDPEGRVRYRHTGLMNKTTLVRLFREYSQ